MFLVAAQVGGFGMVCVRAVWMERIKKRGIKRRKVLLAGVCFYLILMIRMRFNLLNFTIFRNLKE